jgi:predicted regulator of Ras-like GTPase activity (Roadblock/LC7/MglB family)
MCTGQKPLMNSGNIVLYEGEYLRLTSVLSMTQRDLRAELVLLIDRNGQRIACEGPSQGIDLTAFASLAAANIAATEGLARIVGEPEFSVLFHQGKHRSIHISDIAKRYSLVVVFDDNVSLGMVRLKVKRATAYLDEIFRSFQDKMESPVSAHKVAQGSAPRLYFTDEDIDKLFSYLQPNR